MGASYFATAKIDLIELSDVFRRHAHFSRKGTLQKNEAKLLVEATRRIVCLSSWHLPEYRNIIGNTQVDCEIQKEILNISLIAQRAGLQKITLPLKYNRRDWHAASVKSLFGNLRLPVSVRMRKGDYKIDMSSFGKIDKEVKTALDIGIRGLLPIEPRLRNKWGI